MTSKLGYIITFTNELGELESEVILGFTVKEDAVAFFRKHIYSNVPITSVDHIWVVEPWD